MDSHPAMQVKIDDPDNLSLSAPVGVLRGWIAVSEGRLPEHIHFRIAKIPVSHRMVARGDVEAAMPGYRIAAFEVPYDLAFYLPQIQDHRLGLTLSMADNDPIVFRLQIAETAMADCLSTAGDI